MKKKKNNLDRTFRPKYFTGASAGGINSVLALIESCSHEQRDMDESLLWKIWVPIGLKELVDKKKMGPINIFTREKMRAVAEAAKESFNEGLKKGCTSILGIALTRLKPDYVRFEKNIKVPDMGQYVVIKIEGKGKGKNPVVSNYIVSELAKKQILLPFGEKGVSDVDLIFKAAYATSAFPVAFKPELIKYCRSDGKSTDCKNKKLEQAKYIDGGFFDNVPLTLLAQINEQENFGKKKKKRGRFVYVNPFFTKYFQPEDKSKVNQESLFSYSAKIMNNFVTTSRSKRLLMFSKYEDNNSVRSTSRSFPLISTQMGSFFGFLDEGFRRYDFYIGMLDAWLYLEDFQKREKLKVKSIVREDSKWSPFKCLQKYIIEKSFSGKCSMLNNQRSPEFENTQKLFQLSLVLLYDRCIQNTEKKVAENLLCNEISDKKVTLKDLVIVNGDFEVSELVKSEGEADEEFSLRVLGLLQYQYKDLGLTKEQAPQASYVMQKDLYNALEGVVSLQPQPQKALLSIGLKPAVNVLGYYPPSSYAYVELGTFFEFGYSSDLIMFGNVASPLKFNISISTQGHESLLTGSDNASAITPAAGLEFNLYPLSSVRYQFTLGIKAGYMLARLDDYGRKECNQAAFDTLFTSCSKPTIMVYPLITAIDRLRFKPVFQYFLGTSRWIIGLSFGFNFDINY